MGFSFSHLVSSVVAGVIGVAVVVVGLVTVVVPVLSAGDDESAAETKAATTTPDPTGATETELAGQIVDAPEAWTLIATLPNDIVRYDGPGGDWVGEVPGTWHDRPSVLPVIDQEPGWLHVRLAQRPNESTAWIRRDDVTLAVTPFRIEVDVATMRLRLYDAGEVVMEAPAGIGTDEAPTTLGNYFVTFLQAPPDDTSGWGSFVMVTSNHSDTISDFESSGDAIAAIHGPLGAGDQIGTTGARVSQGCVRLHLDDLAALRDVPAGSPVDVIDSSADTGARA